jgi:hypothetical protein
VPKENTRLEFKRLVVLLKVRKEVQIPPQRPFDKEDITRVKKTNFNGRVKKDVLHASIPWNMLEDFVEGESTCRIFPSAFSWKKQWMVQFGETFM